MGFKNKVSSQISLQNIVTAVVTAITLTTTTIAVADSSSQTLLDGTANRTAHYYSLDLRSGNTSGESSQIVGAQWGSIYNDAFSIGLAINGLMSSIDAPKSRGVGDLSFFYYGAQAEYEAFTWSVFGVNAGVFAGLGQTGYRDPNDPTGKRGKFKDATLQVLEGSAVATINLSPRAKAALGVSYRYATDPNLSGVSGSDLSGLSLLVSLRSGTF